MIFVKAIKCDRCRKFYEPYKGTVAHKNSNMLIFAEDATEAEGNSTYYERRQFDLCPDCMLAAVKFMQAMMAGE